MVCSMKFGVDAVSGVVAVAHQRGPLIVEIAPVLGERGALGEHPRADRAWFFAPRVIAWRVRLSAFFGFALFPSGEYRGT